MALDPTKDYLTPKECHMLLRRVTLSRSDSVSIPRQLARIFEIAETSGTKGSFPFAHGGETIEILYSQQSGGARSALIHRESLNQLVPALASVDAHLPPPKAEAPAKKETNVPKYKSKGELGEEWLSYHDLQNAVEAETHKRRMRQTLKGPSNQGLSRILEALEGETGTVEGIRCHKYRSAHGITIAIHRDDMEPYITLLQKISHANRVTQTQPHNGASVTR